MFYSHPNTPYILAWLRDSGCEGEWGAAGIERAVFLGFPLKLFFQSKHM